MVFFRHYGMTTHVSNVWARMIAAICVGGWMGVDLFFVLSGFLITGILLDTRHRDGYFSNFYARRALRIFPLYYTVFALLLIATPWLHLRWRLGHLAYFFYLGNIASAIDPSLVTVQPAVSFMHLWSLALEEQFYLVWPLIVMLAPSRQRLARLCGWLSLGGFVARLGLLFWLPRANAYDWCYSQLPTHMDGLLYGALGAICARSMLPARLRSAARRVLPISAALLLAVIVADGTDLHSVPMTLVGFPAVAATFTCILLLALQPGSLTGRIGSLSGLRFIGRYSYGMYVYHILFWPALAWMQSWMQVRLGSVMVGGLCFIGLMFAGTMLAAVISYELYEKQWLRLKARFA